MIVFLIGLPGVGKSTVGKKLASALKYDFFETDEIITKKTGKTIKELFDIGEKYFRLVESEVISDVISKSKNSVVSLGGGAILLKENLHSIRNNGIVINLTCKLDKIIERISVDSSYTSRPLLQGSNKEEKISQLFKEREKLYRICDFSVDTTELSPDDVVQKILDFLADLDKVRIIRVNLYDRSYDVLVGDKIPRIHIINRVKRSFQDLRKIALITSPPLKYVEFDGFSPYMYIKSIFEELGEIFEIDLPVGEHVKDILYAIHLWNKFTDIGLKKSDLVVVVGGGVLGDLSGFVSSSYLRGIRYIIVPTTLLSQVDSSIGGKTGVNTDKSKNMIGTIYQPFLVISDISFIKTLPKNDFLSGLGEVLKYAIACDRNLFELISNKTKEILAMDESLLKEVISLSAKIKADIVSEDEYEEKGLRFVLNFGHTIGHAIEASTDFKIPHGFAVATGCVIETKISDKILGKNLYPQVLELVKSFGFECDFKIKDDNKFLSALKLDKKTRADYINFVLLEDIGKSRIEKIKISDFISALYDVLK